MCAGIIHHLFGDTRIRWHLRGYVVIIAHVSDSFHNFCPVNVAVQKISKALGPERRCQIFHRRGAEIAERTQKKIEFISPPLSFSVLLCVLCVSVVSFILVLQCHHYGIVRFLCVLCVSAVSFILVLQC